MSERQTKRARRITREILYARKLKAIPTRAQVKQIERQVRSNLRRSKP